ncbi:MAG: hypothetical protein ACJAVY_002350 [Marinoscillum sp.]|jgi:hypothetical protein
MSLEYNTQRPHLNLREYGRNVQNLVAHIKNTEDKEKRNKYAALLVELMKMINPELSKEANEYTQKVWDDLFIISNFDLDVESPFPIPESTILDRRPDRIRYQSNRIKYRHYGRSVEVLIENAMKLEDPKEVEGAVIAIGRLMKTFYQNWNRETIEDEQVLKTIKEMSNNKLDIDIEKVKTYGLFDSEKGSQRPLDPVKSQNQNRNRNNKGGKRIFPNNKRRRPTN